MHEKEHLSKKLATIWLQNMGGGGLVFQDRYRLDQLALIKNFRNAENEDSFLKISRSSPT